MTTITEENKVKIIKKLIDKRDSFRNIHFLNPSWEGIDKVYSFFQKQFSLSFAEDSHHHSVKQELKKSSTLKPFLGELNIMLWLKFKSQNYVLKEIQFIVSKIASENPSFELAFHPNDLNLTKHPSTDIIFLIEECFQLSCSLGYEICYENEKESSDPFFVYRI